MSALSKSAINSAVLDVPTKRLLEDMISTKIVAAAGSTQADATALIVTINIVTGADGAKGVLLPVASDSINIVVINSVSNHDLIVWPSGTDQINALGASQSYTVSAGTEATFRAVVGGLQWYVYATSTLTGVTTSSTTAELNTLHSVTAGTAKASSALVLGASKNVDTLAVALVSVGTAGIETPITAHSTGGQTSATALSATASVHEITVVGAGNDSVKLPAATGSGNIHWIKNSAAANSAQLFGQATETIDGVTSATGVAIAAGKSRMVVDTAAGKWQSLLGA